MSYIAGGKKLDHVPGPRVRRNKDGDVITKERQRTSQACDVQRLKRLCPEGTSLKDYAKTNSVGRDWLKRKRVA